MYYDRYFSFYKTYRDPFAYENEWMQENEYERMKSYYPQMSRRIQEKVEIECDRIDYEGSRIYDEYPDKYMLRQMCKRIKGQIEKEDTDQLELQSCKEKGPCKPGRSGFIDELIEILLYQEISRRRCRRHRRRCYF